MVLLIAGAALFFFFYWETVRDSVYLKFQDPVSYEDGWYTDLTVIRHACGGINEDTHTNSEEALEASLQAGNRVIEVDLSYTSDGHIVLMHRWEDQYGGIIPDLEMFLSNPVCGYTSMDLSDLWNYMADYPDLYFVIDTKEEEYFSMMEEVISGCPDASRLVFYVTKRGQKARLQEYADLSDSQFVWLWSEACGSAREVVADCYRESIYIVCIGGSGLTYDDVQAFTERGFCTYVYTTNDKDTMEDLIENYGANGVVSDFLSCVI